MIDYLKIIFKNLNLIVLTLLLSSLSAIADTQMAANTSHSCDGLLNHKMKKLNSKEMIDLCQFQGKVVLAVNTASQCGFTPQFKALEQLYQDYKDKGLVVLGFPSNDFRQEHKDEAKTASVCYKNYGVTFPMFTSSSVKGDKANPIYTQLNQQSGKKPQWNFFKYLVNKDQKVVELYSSRTSPDDKVLRKNIEMLLAANK